MIREMHVSLGGRQFPIYYDEAACDIVDQLVYAADEADWSPADGQPVSEWAEDAALVIISRYAQPVLSTGQTTTGEQQ